MSCLIKNFPSWNNKIYIKTTSVMQPKYNDSKVSP